MGGPTVMVLGVVVGLSAAWVLSILFVRDPDFFDRHPWTGVGFIVVLLAAAAAVDAS